jgi:hypothetical protein
VTVFCKISKLTKSITLPFILILFVFPVYGEIIHLKDGQVLKGSIIKENNQIIVVKTRYLTRRIKRANIKRILYGERDAENIYIQKISGKIISGFLVDQDSHFVFFRRTKESPEEIKIPKSDIKQMSRTEIIPINPDITLRAAMFYPLNPGGSDLAVSPMFIVGTGFNFTPIKKVRIVPEIGYVKSESKTNTDQYLKIIPITMNITYNIPVSFFSLIPKAGIGMAVVDFNNGEGELSRGYDLYCNAGAGAVYNLIDNLLTIGLWVEYNMISDGAGNIHNILLSGGFSYVF